MLLMAALKLIFATYLLLIAPKPLEMQELILVVIMVAANKIAPKEAGKRPIGGLEMNYRSASLRSSCAIARPPGFALCSLISARPISRDRGARRALYAADRADIFDVSCGHLIPH